MKNKLPLKILIPVLLIVLGAAGAALIIRAKPQPQARTPEQVAPLVRIHPVELGPFTYQVESQGTVAPRSEGELSAEVTGQIVDVSPAFAVGGFFRKGEVLLRIDPRDARQRVALAEADLAGGRRVLAEEEARAEIARQEWDDLGGGEATPLTLREPQLAQARATIEAVKATLERARRDLERTEIRAPYEGRVRKKMVDVGKYVGPGAPLAEIYAVDYAEIRLPLPDADLAHLDLPLAYSNAGPGGSRPSVTLHADFAGRRIEWQGEIVRTEGVIDPKSRMVTAVARVKGPYARGDDADRPPLAVGLFVEAEIAGRRVEQAAVIPRSAIRNENQVLIVDAEERLRFRDVVVGRWMDDRAVVIEGLADGERVCLSNLTAVTDGMSVRILDDGGPS